MGILDDFFTRSIQRTKNPWNIAFGDNKGYDEESLNDPYKNIRFNPQNAPENEPSYGGNTYRDVSKTPTRGMNNFDQTQFSSPAMERYLEHASNVPLRENYSPSIWHRIVGSLAGAVSGGTKGPLAGIESAERVLEMPYRRAVEDYEFKGQGLEAGAKLEQTKQKQRLDYMKAVNDSENDRINGMIKDNDSRTRAKRAEIDAQRYEWKNRIDQAKNEIQATEARNQMTRWEAQSANELAGLENERKELSIRQQEANTNALRGTAYQQSVTGLNQSRATRLPYTQPALQAGREVIISELQNERPDLFDDSGMPEDDASSNMIEQEIQARLRRRIPGYGNIALPPEQGGGGPVPMNPRDIAPSLPQVTAPVVPVAPLPVIPEAVAPPARPTNAPTRRYRRVQ